MTTPAPTPLLFSFDGKAAPPELAPALCQLTQLPVEQKENIVELLAPCLEPLPEDQLENRIGRLCRRHELDPALVGPGFKAVVVMFRSAVAMGCEPDEIAQDLRALDTAAGQDLVDLLIPVYRAVFAQLRMRVVQETIATHGPVLTGIEWRVDTVGSSSRGKRLDVPVALMTFMYQKGPQPDMFTLQMLPDAVAELREICDQLLKGE